ncbi:unnamed protein product [Pleuronectes platessa]|uniref:Uncharacterized protein n=1 Tax=Pleuronectes platessa TaxID=8262 RepID=A0A9N7TTY6_PLEPL|nr:unnamed protein product [Pleuronectes platessa]
MRIANNGLYHVLKVRLDLRTRPSFGGPSPDGKLLDLMKLVLVSHTAFSERPCRLTTSESNVAADEMTSSAQPVWTRTPWQKRCISKGPSWTDSHIHTTGRCMLQANEDDWLRAKSWSFAARGAIQQPADTLGHILW